MLRGLRSSDSDPVCLFLDEVNRIPRQHLNLLLGLMNPKTGVICRAQGMRVSGEGPFYVIEVPMTSEVVACPAAHLRIVAAGNFGRAYQVYDLDPAVRRRFDTVIEFDYLSYADELSLVNRQTAGITACVGEALVKMAHETRRMMANGELPGCIDTASLLNWARKCQRSGAGTVVTVMNEARLTWTDLVCGRDHIGKVNSGSFQALQDYLVSLGLLPDDTTLSI
jgi:MoxR-like ATPase